MGDEAHKIIYSMVGVSKRHDKKQILKDIHLSYFYGAKIGVLGLNGAGKSTLLRILAGIDKDYEGQISLQPGYTVGFLEQEPKLDDSMTVRQVVEQGMQQSMDLLKEYEQINERLCEEMSEDDMTKLLERQGQVHEQLDAINAWEIDAQLEMAMDALRCPEGDRLVKVLSGGERRRVALCRLLLQKPDVLLLDEPTNHLDAETVAWLEQHLKRYEGTIIAVTHDRYFLDNVAGWILELDRGQGIPWKGNYSSWLEQKETRLRVEEKTESARQRALQRELEWIRRSPQARRAKNKARISAYEEAVAQDATEKLKEIEIYIPPGPRLGNQVIDARNVTKAFGRQILLSDVSFSIPAGAIVGIIGANGTGKTTLFRMITGQEKPDAGTIRVGESVKLTYVEQSRETLKETDTVWQAITGGREHMQIGNASVNSRVYVTRYGFTGQDQQQQVGTLSGGERNRVHLARMLTQGANVIMLDEPTNDLDVNVMRALEDAIENFAGCALVISHDRWFLDRVATHILAFEGDSTVRWFNGNYSAYEADRKTRLGVAADQPHRVKYRELTMG
ncbi:MAG: energy-dependent translational throttle protein EttA [Planctomycetia bacterium]|nr:energy-dependent translational throttle protein EttA [Planctomycetia bacterium]